jgi:hypothetical protein
MTTEDIIIQIFCVVDDRMKEMPKHPQAKLYPSELVTIGLLFALKGGHFRAFYRWLKRDWEALFAGLPDRTRLQRLLVTHQDWNERFLADPSFFLVIDSYPIELLFPIREGRSPQQFGKKSKDKGRWSIGVKLCWVLNRFGQVVDWDWDTMNTPDNQFHELIQQFSGSIVLADYGFRKQNGVPENCKLCPKGQWNASHGRNLVLFGDGDLWPQANVPSLGAVHPGSFGLSGRVVQCAIDFVSSGAS